MNAGGWAAITDDYFRGPAARMPAYRWMLSSMDLTARVYLQLQALVRK